MYLSDTDNSRRRKIRRYTEEIRNETNKFELLLLLHIIYVNIYLNHHILYTLF